MWGTIGTFYLRKEKVQTTVLDWTMSQMQYLLTPLYADSYCKIQAAVWQHWAFLRTSTISKPKICNRWLGLTKWDESRMVRLFHSKCNGVSSFSCQLKLKLSKGELLGSDRFSLDQLLSWQKLSIFQPMLLCSPAPLSLLHTCTLHKPAQIPSLFCTILSHEHSDTEAQLPWQLWSMCMKASNLFNSNKEEVLQAQQPPMLNIVKKESLQPVNQICKDWQY